LGHFQTYALQQTQRVTRSLGATAALGCLTSARIKNATAGLYRWARWRGRWLAARRTRAAGQASADRLSAWDQGGRRRAFQQALETFGWVDGRNIEIVARFGAADPDRNRAHVAELIALGPDVIVSSNAPSIIALMKETRTIPIVIANTTDPVALGFVEPPRRQRRSAHVKCAAATDGEAE
jgi:ABC transporter substrate binding protein